VAGSSSQAYSGCAADGILKTLTLKHEIASAAGSLPRRELPTGLRDGDGYSPEGLSPLDLDLNQGAFTAETMGWERDSLWQMGLR
jgi:hypothetical protein